MSEFYDAPFAAGHDHVFLGAGHQSNERKTWGVIVLCSLMMLAEIVGGQLFGSLALIADGLHMSTHAGAMLIAALAYTYARKHAHDRRFVFGTGKLGDLAGFTSAIILAMIALLIGYEAALRLLSPVPIHFAEAIPIAVLGLVVNVVSAWMLSGDGHHGHAHGGGHAHGHGHGHGHGHEHADETAHQHNDEHDHAHADGHAHPPHDEVRVIDTQYGQLALSIFEEGMAPVFRLHARGSDARLPPAGLTITTTRTDGVSHVFSMLAADGFLQSHTSISEPHTFDAVVQLNGEHHTVRYDDAPGHDHAVQNSAGGAHEDHALDTRDHNMRAAYMHIIADAAVSVLAIIGLLLARWFGWLWMDPLAGIVGALVIANWSYGLIRDTGAILTDMSPGDALSNKISAAIAQAGDQMLDLHVWRLGPGHLGAVVSVATSRSAHDTAFYHAALRPLKGISHLTVEVHCRAAAA